MPSASTLRDAFLDELRDLYNLEKHLIHTLPKLARSATTAALSDAFESHLNETIAHVDRLERVFTGLGEMASDTTYESLASVLEQGDDIIADGFDEAATDAMLIAAAQRIEHYEITAYGTAIAWAGAMGHDEAARLLQETLTEEKATDEKLTSLATGGINQQAAAIAYPDKPLAVEEGLR